MKLENDDEVGWREIERRNFVVTAFID